MRILVCGHSRKPRKLEFLFRFVTAFCDVFFSFAVLTFDRNTQRTRLLLSILINFRQTSSSKNKRWKILSIFICLYPSALSKWVFRLKILKMRIKNIFTCYSLYWIWCSRWIQLWCCYTLVIVSTCHLYLLSCAGYPLYNTESIIGQDVLRII